MILVGQGLERWWLASAVSITGLAIYLNDCYYVYVFLLEQEEENEKDVPQEAIDNVELHYKGKAALELYNVDNNTYAIQLQAASKYGETVQDMRPYEIQRESILFLGGGRAATLQLAHPYVAEGIEQHSNLKHGIQQRFYRTFHYMFAMLYGDLESSVEASRTVRKLHNAVHGRFKENIGIFQAGEKYSASHGHALLWVHLTLLDTSLFMYEVFVQRLSQYEKDCFITANNHFAMNFFAVPQQLLPRDARQLVEMMRSIVRSQVIAVGNSARRIDCFLWTPPSLRFWPLLSLVRWLTFIQLPRKLRIGLYGRTCGTFEIFCASLVLGFFRFVYRMLPFSARWLTAYHSMQDRLGNPLSQTGYVLSRISAAFASALLRRVMPTREPELFVAMNSNSH